MVQKFTERLHTCRGGGMVDTPALGAGAFGRGGSSPLLGTTKNGSAILSEPRGNHRLLYVAYSLQLPREPSRGTALKDMLIACLFDIDLFG